MLSELTVPDVLPPLVTFLAALVAAARDVLVRQPVETNPVEGDTHSQKRWKLDFSKLSPLVVVIIFLAFISFSITLYGTNKAKKSASDANKKLTEMQENTKNIKYTAAKVLEEVREQLPKFVGDTIGESGNRIKGTIAESEESLRSSIASVTKASLENVNQSMSQSVAESQKAIEKTLTNSVTNLQAGITDTVNKEVAKSVTAIEAARKRLDETMATQIMQIPLQIAQKSPPRRLTGKLSDLLIKVGDVSSRKEFPVVITSEKDGKPLDVECDSGSGCRIDKDGTIYLATRPKTDGDEKKGHAVSFTHRGRKYRMEMAIETNRNLVGSGGDYLICQVVEQ